MYERTEGLTTDKFFILIFKDRHERKEGQPTNLYFIYMKKINTFKCVFFNNNLILIYTERRKEE